jgi:deoxycytidylate deaminase
MRYLTGNEEAEALEHLNTAIEIAKMSTCQRAKCGSIIVKDRSVIGTGYNSPPGNKEENRRCSYSKDSYDKKVTDKTCCVHAEERAIMDALKKNPNKITGAKMYFARLDNEGSLTKISKPYCTICSKMIIDAEIIEFILWHDGKIYVYDAGEYNTISYQYRG